MDTTTRAVTVTSSVVTVQVERPAIKTPDIVLPVNLGGFPLFVSNVTPFAFCLLLFVSIYTAMTNGLVALGSVAQAAAVTSL